MGIDNRLGLWYAAINPKKINYKKRLICVKGKMLTSRQAGIEKGGMDVEWAMEFLLEGLPKHWIGKPETACSKIDLK